MATPSLNSTFTKLKPYRMLDGWRGIASLAVVLFHWSETFTTRHREYASYPLYVAGLQGSYGVFIFFVISGFCITSAAWTTLGREHSIWSFVWARIRRIYPTYWAALALLFFIDYFGYALASRGSIQATGFTAENPLQVWAPSFLPNFTLMMGETGTPSILPVAWTLSQEVAFYAIVGAALAFAAWRRSPVLLIRTVNAVTVASLIMLIVRSPFMLFPFNLWPAFGLGALTFDLLQLPKRPDQKVWPVLIAPLTIACIAMRTDDLNVSVGCSLALAFSALILGLYRYDERISETKAARILSLFGLFSYSLYLTHFFIVRIAGQVFERLHIPPSMHLLMTAAAVTFAICFAYLFFLLFEKPLIKSRRKYAVQSRIDAAAATVS